MAGFAQLTSMVSRACSRGFGVSFLRCSRLHNMVCLCHRLQTGWSVHTFQTDKQRKMQALNPKELDVILEVIHRAEKLDLVEQQRIGYVAASWLGWPLLSLQEESGPVLQLWSCPFVLGMPCRPSEAHSSFAF